MLGFRKRMSTKVCVRFQFSKPTGYGIEWNGMKRNEMIWNWMKWKEKKWNEMKSNEIKWIEMKCGMKWNEMKWN